MSFVEKIDKVSKHIPISIKDMTLPILVKEYKILEYEQLFNDIFYNYYSNFAEDPILKYELKALRKKLIVDYKNFVNGDLSNSTLMVYYTGLVIVFIILITI